MRAETFQPGRHTAATHARRKPCPPPDVEPDVCPFCGLVHQAPAVAKLPAVEDDCLPLHALRVLDVTAQAWTPLAGGGHVPMPLATRKRWAELREDFAKGAGHTYINAENQEWFMLPNRWRMAMLLLIGVDGDLGSLASRDFQRMPPPERAAIKSEVRLAKRLFGRMVALASIW